MNKNLKSQLATILANSGDDNYELMSQLKKLIYDDNVENAMLRESKSIGDLFDESVLKMEQSDNTEELFKTGYIDFDKAIGGFVPGEFVVFGARPGMGKTQLLVNLALNFVRHNPVLYFSFDMSEYMLTTRMIAALTEVESSRILQNNLSNDERERILKLQSILSNVNLFINDGYNNSISAFKAHCIKMIQEKGVKIIIVDYLQLMSSNKFRNSREIEIGSICRELKNLAKDYKVCVIGASQLSRAVETRGGDKRPMLSDLRETGAIEQDADKVIFVYRPAYYGLSEDENGAPTDGIMELIIAKNRNGSIDTVRLGHNKKFTAFHDKANYDTDFIFNQDRLDELNKPPF